MRKHESSAEKLLYYTCEKYMAAVFIDCFIAVIMCNQ